MHIWIQIWFDLIFFDRVKLDRDVIWVVNYWLNGFVIICKWVCFVFSNQFWIPWIWDSIFIACILHAALFFCLMKFLFLATKSWSLTHFETDRAIFCCYRSLLIQKTSYHEESLWSNCQGHVSLQLFVSRFSCLLFLSQVDAYENDLRT